MMMLMHYYSCIHIHITLYCIHCIHYTMYIFYIIYCTIYISTRYMMTRHSWHEANQHLVDLDTIHFMHPLLNMDGILGGLYTPGDGHTDPYSLTMV